MSIHIQLPADEGAALLMMLKEKAGFAEPELVQGKLRRTQDEARAWYGTCGKPSF